METIQQIAAKYSYGRPDMQRAPAAPERTPRVEDRAASRRVGCGSMVVLRLSAANAFLDGLTESEKQQRHFREEHLKRGRIADANRCAAVAAAFEEMQKEFRRLTGLTVERQPQHNIPQSGTGAARSL